MEKNSNTWKIVKGTYLEQFFAQQDKFWENGIMNLPEKWQKVAEQNGDYVVQCSSRQKWKVSFIFT